MQSLFFSKQTKGKIVINKVIEAPYLKGSNKEVFLVFFGYVGCTKVCTPILHRLNDFYTSKAFAPLKPYVGLTFVNLMPEVTPEQPGEFAHSFNPNFQGVYLSQRQLMGIDRDFALFFSKSLRDISEIDHSDYVYLMERQKDGRLKLHSIYMTHPLNASMLQDDIAYLLKSHHE
ncbi:MAG: SCO family protein [Sulfuricurvum sp.]|nr:SCO family protein [Sulfuricurvum sp.]